MGIHVDGQNFGTYWERGKYEQAMANDSAFQALSPDAKGEQMGRYCEGIQYDQRKARNKQLGREIAALHQQEQAALTQGLNGQLQQIQTVITDPTRLLPAAEDGGVKIVAKTASKDGKRMFLVDSNGKAYSVDKATYKAAQKGKMIKLFGDNAVPIDPDTIPKAQRNNLKKYLGKFDAPVVKPPVTQDKTLREISGEWTKRSEEFARKHPHGQVIIDPPLTPLHEIVGPVSPKNPKINVITTPRDTSLFVELVDESFGIGVKDPEAELLRRKLALQERAGQTSDFRDFSRECTGRSKYFAGKVDDVVPNNADDLGKKIDDLGRKIDDLANRPLIDVELNQRLTNIVNNKIDSGTKILSEQITNVNKNITSLKNDVKIVNNVTKVDQKLTQVVNHVDDKFDDVLKVIKKGNARTALIAGAAFVGALGGALLGAALVNNKKSEEAVDVESEKTTEPEKEVPVEQSKDATDKGFKNNIKVDLFPKIEVPTFEIPELDLDAKVEEQNEEAGAESAKAKKLELNADGTYTTKKGDSFWKIAERYLEDTVEGFNDMTKQEKDKLIYKETMKIMKENGHELAEDKWHSQPPLMQNIKVQVVKKVDQAA